MKRYMLLLGLSAATLGAGLVVAGRGDGRSMAHDSRSVLYAGETVGRNGSRHVVTDAEARRNARTVRAFWLSHVEGPAGTVSPRDFRSRLAQAARRYGFTVKRVEFVHTRGRPAPLVIVETRRYVAFARATPAVVRSLDPMTDETITATGDMFWTLPGLFLEADDERGVPFLVVDHLPGGGGQWARSDELHPYAHG